MGAVTQAEEVLDALYAEQRQAYSGPVSAPGRQTGGALPAVAGWVSNPGERVVSPHQDPGLAASAPSSPRACIMSSGQATAEYNDAVGF
ncbi:hypothetical protein HBB16_17525 [Pseudonocardia sp. MCCB 268]|nr:hypothetical protein [Pseudonocardia cytotoxica]